MRAHKLITICLLPGWLFAGFVRPCFAQNFAAPVQPVIAVGLIQGDDPALGSFLADTLTNELARSPRLRLIDQSSLHKMLEDANLSEEVLSDPSQMRQASRILGVSRVIIGSYFHEGNRMVMTIRMVDMNTGTIVPGSSSSAAGPDNDTLGVVQRVADRLYRRVIGHDMIMDTLPADAVAVENSGPPEVTSAADQSTPFTATIPAPVLAPTPPMPQNTPSLPVTDPNDKGPFTGLLVEAPGVNIIRTMGARVLDANGRLVYPTPNHMPSPDFVDDQGTVGYVHLIMDAHRAGDHPFMAAAIGHKGDDLIISVQDADRILGLNRDQHFLWDYKVDFLVDAGR